MGLSSLSQLIKSMSEEKHENLEPPVKAPTSTEDPGAHELTGESPFTFERKNMLISPPESSESEDHFSDAQTDLDQPAVASPIPITRVEKVDNKPSHGEVPGTDAYDLRTKDAVPDEVTLVTNAEEKEVSRPSTPGGLPVPITVVEKLDPASPSHGEVPGTEAHEKRKADAVPDLVIRTSGHGHSSSLSNPPSANRSRAGSTPGDLPIPTTKVEKVDSSPSHGEVPGTKAWELRKEDAQPDLVEEVGDVSGKNNSTPFPSKALTDSRNQIPCPKSFAAEIVRGK